MSLSSTFLLFLDVWGLGNRGMFRTLRDLVLRPGYLICDYVNGRHGAYFPPFKLLFLLTTLSILIGHGFNIFMMDYIGDFKPLSISIQDETEILVSQWVNRILRFVYEYPALSSLTLMIFMANFIFLLFRKSKVIGKMSYHAIIIASVYMLDMNLLYTCFFRFFGAGSDIIYMSLLLYIIPLKQFSGYSMIKTVSRAFVALLLGLISILMLFIIILQLPHILLSLRPFLTKLIWKKFACRVFCKLWFCWSSSV